MQRLKFGTDGIRGVYGEHLTEDTAYRLGAALGLEGSLLIGRDNRPSSPSLARAVACGAACVGAEVLSVGLITTPALYYLTRRLGYHRGVMVTASHNPAGHNGLKVFTAEGKPSDLERQGIEEAMDRVSGAPDLTRPYREDPSPLCRYERHFRECACDLTGMRVVIDYAGGAGYAFRELLHSLGAEVIPLSLREDGSRVNEGCGALHPEECRRATLRVGADLGFALDGDGDRIVAVDARGEVLDGDRIAYLLARRMKERAVLAENKVVLTVMTNGGVLKSLTDQGITPVTCAVGDSAVAEKMRTEGANLGGEQSGHIILSDYLPTGDGLFVGAALLKSIREDGPLEETPAPILYPQVRLDVPVIDPAVAATPRLQEFVSEVQASLGSGRILLRASGTESVVRILVEHPDGEIAILAAQRLRSALLAIYSDQA